MLFSEPPHVQLTFPAQHLCVTLWPGQDTRSPNALYERRRGWGVAERRGVGRGTPKACIIVITGASPTLPLSYDEAAINDGEILWLRSDL